MSGPGAHQDCDPVAAGSSSAAHRLLGRTLDRLTVRLAIGIALLVIGPIAVGFYALSQRYVDQTIDARRKAAESQNRILEAALRHQMLEKDTVLMSQVLHEIGSQPEVRRAMILDHEGEIRISSQSELVGDRVSQDSATCVACHAKEPEERELWTLLDSDEGEVLRSVLPIENRPECHRCHSAEARLNGILILDVSLDALRAEQDRELMWMVAGTAALALLVLSGVGFLVRRLILERLGRLGRTARSIAAGNLDERVALDGNDVITALADDFNNMADSVSTLIREVREQESRLRGVMNSLDDGLVFLDKDGSVLAANRSFSRRLGAHAEALHGRPCKDLADHVLPCCASGLDCPAERCVATGEVQRRTYRVPGTDGAAEVVEEVYACPVFDQNGSVVQVVEVWRDISERVKEEERLAEIERLVSLGVLASGFSHEVNTPLASVLTCADSVLGRLKEAEGGRIDADAVSAIGECAEIIREQVLRCRKVTEQFLRFSRGIPPSIEPIDLRQTVAAIVSLATPTAREAGVTIELEGNGRIPAVTANAEVVQHVVLNLLVNAIQSCEGGTGRIAVRIHAGEDVRIDIEDTGCGIPPEHRRLLFEPFRSEKPQGTGLGLFLSRTFMRRFGGDVRLVDSEVGKGSRFQIIFAGAAGVAS